MDRRVLVTGSEGLVGKAVVAALVSGGAHVSRFDVRLLAQGHGDIRDFVNLRDALTDIHGVIHLAGISRVVFGEQDPALCWKTNVGGLQNLLQAAADAPWAPWVIFASSREVYGQPEHLPVQEDYPIRPVNIYGRTKAEGERLIAHAQRSGIRACSIRLSNVFGSVVDHPDRVVPAFARAASLGRDLRVDGVSHIFDFTHVEDVARGIVILAQLLEEGDYLPPTIHFVTGVPTSLGELSASAIRIANSRSRIVLAPPRSFDVARFVGCPDRAERILGWKPQISLDEGLTRLVKDFGSLAALNRPIEGASPNQA